jgi:hypothetical protein
MILAAIAIAYRGRPVILLSLKLLYPINSSYNNSHVKSSHRESPRRTQPSISSHRRISNWHPATQIKPKIPVPPEFNVQTPAEPRSPASQGAHAAYRPARRPLILILSLRYSMPHRCCTSSQRATRWKNNNSHGWHFLNKHSSTALLRAATGVQTAKGSFSRATSETLLGLRLYRVACPSQVFSLLQ